MNLYIHFLRGGKGTLFDAGRIEGRRLVFEKKANVLVFHKRGTIARLERINQGNSLKICFPENYFIRKLPKNIDSGIIQNINILKITPFVESLL